MISITPIQKLFSTVGYAADFDRVYQRQQKRWQEIWQHADLDNCPKTVNHLISRITSCTIEQPDQVIDIVQNLLVSMSQDLIRESQPTPVQEFTGKPNVNENCDICNGLGVVVGVPIRQERPTLISLDRVKHDRVRQMLARRAYKLAFELSEYNHYHKGFISRDAVAGLMAAADNNVFVKSYDDISQYLPARFRSSFRCSCLAGIAYAGINEVDYRIEEYVYLRRQQKEREFKAYAEFCSFPLYKTERFSAFNRRLQDSQFGKINDATFFDGYTDDYDYAGKIYNKLRFANLDD